MPNPQLYEMTPKLIANDESGSIMFIFFIFSCVGINLALLVFTAFGLCVSKKPNVLNVRWPFHNERQRWQYDKLGILEHQSFNLL